MEWHREFRAKVNLYVAQSKLNRKQEAAVTQGNFINPFLSEVRKPWEWTQFYRSVAKPIDGVDPTLPDGVPVGMADGNGMMREAPHSSDHPNMYDIDSAFAELRRRHASEAQNFVIAHQKIAMEKLLEELALPNQICMLQDKLSVWAAAQTSFIQSQPKQAREEQVKGFVELVHRDEMPKAEMKIKDEHLHSFVSIAMIRFLCIVAVAIAATTMSHEVLVRLFAIFFALGCGMALLWEDLLTCCMRFLLGETVRRLRILGATQERMAVPTPNFIQVHVPTVIW